MILFHAFHAYPEPLVVKVDYEFQVIFIRFIGSHADYDKIDTSTF
ncbi:MAG: HigB toxin, RelE-like toxic component of a toxin-antitoxin system [Cyanobacteriota bacterium]|jgi:mRNA-degrading endonuclease HigB of HigAB toxin-antitoxin module